MTLLFSFFLIGLVGACAAMCRLCFVTMIKEMVWDRDLTRVVSFLKIMVWGWLAVVLISSLSGEALWSSGYPFGWGIVVGGAMFGLGARLNETCVFGAINKLVRGDLRMVLALVGMCVGFAAETVIKTQSGLWDYPFPTADGWSLNLWTRVILLALLGVWGIREIVEMVKGERLRTEAVLAVLGLSIGGLLFFYAYWSYPIVFHLTIQSVLGKEGVIPPRWDAYLIFPILLLGAWLASRKQFEGWIWASGKKIWPYFGGGILMGLGVSLIPGDIIHLTLHSGLSFSFHTIPAVLGVVGGIILGFIVLPPQPAELKSAKPSPKAKPETIPPEKKPKKQPPKKPQEPLPQEEAVPPLTDVVSQESVSQEQEALSQEKAAPPPKNAVPQTKAKPKAKSKAKLKTKSKNTKKRTKK